LNKKLLLRKIWTLTMIMRLMKKITQKSLKKWTSRKWPSLARSTKPKLRKNEKRGKSHEKCEKRRLKSSKRKKQ